MDIRLKELLHNLKDRNWDVNPTYSIDENEARRIIEGIEEVENGGKWVSCSERLPEKSGDYLVWLEPYQEKSFISIEEIDCDGIMKKWNYVHPWEIEAWMPLPQPYKAESEV